MDFSRLVAWPMKNFDKIFDESIHVHHNPLGPIGVLDEESSSKTKRNAKKSAPQWMAPLRRMPMPSLSLRSLCTGAGLHSGTRGLAKEKLFCIFLFSSRSCCCSPSVAHKAQWKSKGPRIERETGRGQNLGKSRNNNTTTEEPIFHSENILVTWLFNY